MSLRAYLLDTLRDLETRAPADCYRTAYQLARLISLRGLTDDVPEVEDVHAALLGLYDDGYVDFTEAGWTACERRQEWLDLETVEKEW